MGVTRRPLVAAAVTAAALLALPAAAHAACPKMTGEVDEPEAVLDFSADSELVGGPLEGGKVHFPGHFYEATGAIVLEVLGNEYSISKGAVFKLTCYGSSAADKNLKPALMLMHGKVRVKTGAKKPGGVVTPEGLIDPRTDPTMTFSVERKIRTKADLDAILDWFAENTSQPKGTTKAKAPKGGPIIGVTPYVGPRSGTCRYVHAARLTLKGFNSKGYSTGTSSFTK